MVSRFVERCALNSQNPVNIKLFGVPTGQEG